MKVEGFFSGIKNANKAVQELKNNGFHKAKVDINEHYISKTRQSPSITNTQNSVNLSGLILNNEGFASEDITSPLKAASPMASGMGGFEEVSDINYKVTVETKASDIEKAKGIIKGFGGNLRNYNLELPKRID